MIHVVDQMMGRGKTSAAINHIIDHPDDKFIYITPYLNEVDRVMKQCQFSQPVKYADKAPKILDFKALLNRGKNIVTTHALFSYFDDEICDLCYAQGYTLIMDEVHDVVEPYNIKRADLDTMIDKYVDILDNGTLKWRDESVETFKYENEKRLCMLGCLAVYSNNAMVWMFPVKVFEAFREAYILTYMFGAQIQKYYYDFYGLKYDYLYVRGDSLSSYCFCDEPQGAPYKYDYSSLINIVEDAKLNMIGDAEGALSKTWYIRNEGNALIKQLKKNLINFFNNKRVLWDEGLQLFVQSSSGSNLWTTFSDFRKALSGKGYTKGFIPSNMRASNEYRDRTVVAYTINKYFNPIIKNFFLTNGIEVDEDGYAISEMLQFIWRSGIRDGKRISLYIPSARMRALLIQWIETHKN